MITYPYLSPAPARALRLLLHHGYPGTSHHCSTVAAKGGTPNPILGTHSVIHFWGHLSYNIIGLVFTISCHWHHALLHNSLLHMVFHLVLTIFWGSIYHYLLLKIMNEAQRVMWPFWSYRDGKRQAWGDSRFQSFSLLLITMFSFSTPNTLFSFMMTTLQTLHSL